MFYKYSSLTSLKLPNFNTNNVTNMERMFYKCSSLTTLNLSNFNTNNVINMKYMFYKCYLFLILIMLLKCVLCSLSLMKIE